MPVKVTVRESTVEPSFGLVTENVAWVASAAAVKLAWSWTWNPLFSSRTV